jgi:hypothetical protein
VDTKLQALFCQNVLHIQNDKIPICKLYFDGLFHIGIFQMLLPKGCCRSVLHSDEYQESYQCNFLGLSAQGSLPNHIFTTEMFVLHSDKIELANWYPHHFEYVAHSDKIELATWYPQHF